MKTKVMTSVAMLAALALSGCETLSETFPALSGPLGASAATVDAPETTDTVETAAVEENTAPTVEDARAYIEAAEAELAAQSEYAARVFWNQATNITFDTNFLAARAGSESTQMSVRLANGTKQFEGLDLPADLARKIQILRSGITIPAPSTEGAADELAQITTRLDSTYATGTFNYKGEDLNLDQLSTIIETSRDPEELQAVWEGWRTVSPVMRDEYARMVEIANAGATELGFDNVADMWLSNYDMEPQAMSAEVERLWTQVEPLYKELHCYVRAELNEEYGDEVQSTDGPIRADLLGNMWAQSWSSIYPLVAPETAGESYDLTAILEERGFTPVSMVEQAEGFFSSMGIRELPDTFWERSQIVRPRDREVVCHASAWDLDNEEDVRIKMCTEVNAEDFFMETRFIDNIMFEGP